MDSKTCKKLLAELPALRNEEVLEQESLDKLAEYLEAKCEQKSSLTKLTVAFISIIGGLMIGGGICLLFAHNWDEMSRNVRAVVSITPLIIGIILGYYLIIARKSVAWKEGIGAFLFIAALASLGLICQTYNLGGNLADFYFVVLLMTLPLPWVLNSKSSATLWLVILTCWVWSVWDWSYRDSSRIYWFWPLFAIGGSYFAYAWNKHGIAMKTYIAWLLSIFILTVLGPVINSKSETLVFTSYFAVFCIMFMLGTFDRVNSQIKFSPFTSLGRSGALVMSLFVINSDVLKDLMGESILIAVIIAAVSAVACLTTSVTKKRYDILIGIFPLLAVCIGSYSDFGKELPGTVMTFLLAIMSGVMLWEGTRKQSMATLNSGMFLIGLIAIIKFAESDLPILVRAILFICVGVIFLSVNLYLVLKRHRKAEVRKETAK